MTRNLIVLGCAALLAFGLSFGSFAGSSPDSDSDGVPDAFDNCSSTANGPLAATPALCNAQQDFDVDGYGQACDPDVNNDGGVGLDDVNDVLGAQGSGAGNASDLNCDGGVGLDDANIVLGSQGATPGPSGLSCAGSGTPCSAQ
jgi:hypothetical protein